MCMELEKINLEIKKINDEKKAVLAVQFAAEATLRRVHAAQKDDEMPSIEAIIAPLEAELKLSRLEAKAATVDDLQNRNQDLTEQIEEDKRILDHELDRAKIFANRVVIVTNDSKDATDKVMPVKQWLEERKYYQA
ncbi:hypothetical protein EJD97_016875 [Solanum chilense]|uniref:Uncharacterized protein n=1 Tax=Solanum chilense TaxID=4083 RepID=A0A6N2B440_SOLCI|nr:hypothetical protein EJD97_016875 [Solanum chilense]